MVITAKEKRKKIFLFNAYICAYLRWWNIRALKFWTHHRKQRSGISEIPQIKIIWEPKWSCCSDKENPYRFSWLYPEKEVFKTLNWCSFTSGQKRKKVEVFLNEQWKYIWYQPHVNWYDIPSSLTWCHFTNKYRLWFHRIIIKTMLLI